MALCFSFPFKSNTIFSALMSTSPAIRPQPYQGNMALRWNYFAPWLQFSCMSSDPPRSAGLLSFPCAFRPIVGILEGDTARTVNASLTSQREFAHLHQISTRESAAARDVTAPPRASHLFEAAALFHSVSWLTQLMLEKCCSECISVRKHWRWNVWHVQYWMPHCSS